LNTFPPPRTLCALLRAWGIGTGLCSLCCSSPVTVVSRASAWFLARLKGGTYEALRAIIEGRWRLTTIMRSFWAGVATTIVGGAFVLFALWLVTTPKVLECVSDDSRAAISMDLVATRKFGYLRTYEVGDCTAYFVASNKAQYFR
jgi:hypothetical protein